MAKFQCDACESIFSNQSNLNRHIQACSLNGELNFRCSVCDQTFTRIDNLKRHELFAHSVKSEASSSASTSASASASARTNFECPICQKHYQLQKNLRRHIRQEHISVDSVDASTSTQAACSKCCKVFSKNQELAQHYLSCIPVMKKSQEKSPIRYPRECNKCKTVFKSKQSFSVHVPKCGVEVSLKSSKRKCILPDCTYESYHVKSLVKHLMTDHENDPESHEYTLKSYDEFKIWKEQIEGDTCTSYTAPCGSKKTQKCTYSYFSCQLEAPDKTHAKSGIPHRKTSRVWKTRGTIPKGNYCPARMYVKELHGSGEVKVTFIESHNHAIDYEHNKHRKVPKSIRNAIVAYLTLGLSPSVIKNLIRGNVGALDQRNSQHAPRKEHYINETYIRRIKYNLKIGNRFDKNDATSVDIIVRNLASDKFQFKVNNEEETGLFSPISVYKPQGKSVVIGDAAIDELPNSADLFLLGIQSREQLRMLQQGAKTVVCIDFTYKLTQYDFYLCNVIVPDEFGKGYPVAHFITNRQDKGTLIEALKSIKVRCPDLEVNFLMTDDDQSEWQAMEKVFPCPRRGICKYHLFQAWQRRLQSKEGIVDLQLRREVFHSLTVLCHERNQETFFKLMHGFIGKYRPLCENFISYFMKVYANRPEVWALSFRNFPHGCTDTNMYCESFHNKIKTFYLERRQNKRVDELIKILLEAEVDRYLEHDEMVREGRRPSNVPVSHQRKHAKGIAIPDSDVSYAEGKQFWVVASQSTEGVEYFVTRHGQQCEFDHCFEICTEAACSDLCSHLYTCTCPDPSGICKHIHKVHSLMVRLKEFQPSKKQVICDSDFTGELHNPMPLEVLAGEQDAVSQSSEEFLKAKCLKYLDRLKENILASSSSTMLQFLATQLRINLGHCEAMLTSSHSDELEKIIPTMSVSGAQKVVPFKELSKFHRTTKKYQGSNENALSKPTFEDRAERKRELLSEAENQVAKRIRNMGPGDMSDETASCSTVIAPKRASKSLSLSKCDSRSFSPKFGFTNNIHQSILFFPGQDGNLSSITFRALKSLDPYVSTEECKRLTVTGGLLGTNADVFRRGWLFEEVINAFLHSLCNDPTIHYFSSLFSQVISNNGNVMAGALNFDVGKVESILIPVNVTNLHWSLFVCKPKEKCLLFYDPASTSCSYQFLNFHDKLCRVLKKQYNDIDLWELRCPPHTLQADPISCGVYVCYYAHSICNNSNPMKPVDVNHFRLQIYQTLVKNCLRNKVYSLQTCLYCCRKVTTTCTDIVKCRNCHQVFHIVCVSAKQANPDPNQFLCL